MSEQEGERIMAAPRYQENSLHKKISQFSLFVPKALWKVNNPVFRSVVNLYCTLCIPENSIPYSLSSIAPLTRFPSMCSKKLKKKIQICL